MKDENEGRISSVRRRTSNTFRRRVYVACVIGLAIALVSMAMWPLSAETFRTTAHLKVRISPAAGGVPREPGSGTIDVEYFQKALKDSVHESMTDAALASCIRRAVMQNQSGLAPMTTQQLRESLEVRVSRAMQDPSIRQITISRTAVGHPLDQRVIDLIVQELSSRLSRKANYRILQEQVEQQVNQVASENRRWVGKLLAMVLETRAACERYDDLLARASEQLREAGRDHRDGSTELQQHIEQVQMQVLTSDLQLLRTLREQMIDHFKVDETDSVVQQVERLISDREVVLSQLELPGLSGNGQPGPDKVRSNPFMMATFRKDSQSGVDQSLQSSESMLAQIRLDEAYDMLDQLKLNLENPVVGRIPIVPFAKDIETQPAHFLVTEIHPAGLALPINSVPSDRWLLGMGLIAGLVGIAFSLQWDPHQIRTRITNGRQLADWLGLEHLGSLATDRQKAGWLERALTGFGTVMFRMAEVSLLLMLCGVIVAMIWDDELPALLAEQPVAGFCRAIWVLFGR